MRLEDQDRVVAVPEVLARDGDRISRVEERVAARRGVDDALRVDRGTAGERRRRLAAEEGLQGRARQGHRGIAAAEEAIEEPVDLAFGVARIAQVPHARRAAPAAPAVVQHLPVDGVGEMEGVRAFQGADQLRDVARRQALAVDGAGEAPLAEDEILLPDLPPPAADLGESEIEIALERLRQARRRVLALDVEALPGGVGVVVDGDPRRHRVDDAAHCAVAAAHAAPLDEVELQAGIEPGGAAGLAGEGVADPVGARLGAPDVVVPLRRARRLRAHRVVPFPVEEDEGFARISGLGEEVFAQAGDLVAHRREGAHRAGRGGDGEQVGAEARIAEEGIIGRGGGDPLQVHLVGLVHRWVDVIGIRRAHVDADRPAADRGHLVGAPGEAVRRAGPGGDVGAPVVDAEAVGPLRGRARHGPGDWRNESHCEEQE